jgi:hypothetical protein
MRNFITRENVAIAQKFLARQVTAGKDAVLGGVGYITPKVVGAKNAVVEQASMVGTQVADSTTALASGARKIVQNIAEKNEGPQLAYKFNRLDLLKSLEATSILPKYGEICLNDITFISPFDKEKEGYLNGFLYSFDIAFEDWMTKTSTARIVGYIDDGSVEALVVAIDGVKERAKFTYIDANGKIKTTNVDNEVFFVVLSKEPDTRRLTKLSTENMTVLDGPSFSVSGIA